MGRLFVCFDGWDGVRGRSHTCLHACMHTYTIWGSQDMFIEGAQVLRPRDRRQGGLIRDGSDHGWEDVIV